MSTEATGPTPAELPTFRSLALDAIPEPDFADVQLVALPAGSDADPRVWTDRVFDIRSAPGWVWALMALRQAVVGLVGIHRGDSSAFGVARVEGTEALIDTDDDHLRFCCGVAVDAERSLLRITTVVTLKGWRGRLYFTPVSILHGPVLRAMMIKAVRRSAPR